MGYMAISKKQLEANRKNAKKGGRPVSSATLEAQMFRKALAARITAKADEWMEAIEAAALGHLVAVQDKDGKIKKIYKKAPDATAWSKAMNRAFGNPEQPIVGDLNTTNDVSEETLEELRRAIVEASSDKGGKK